jgi:hypothetical protein
MARPLRKIAAMATDRFELATAAPTRRAARRIAPRRSRGAARMLACLAALLLAPASGNALPENVDICPKAASRSDFPGAVARDARIAARVEERLSREMPGRFTSIEVTAVDGTVCLHGVVPNLTSYRRAEERVREVEGVREVVNRLKIPLAE